LLADAQIWLLESAGLPHLGGGGAAHGTGRTGRVQLPDRRRRVRVRAVPLSQTALRARPHHVRNPRSPPPPGAWRRGRATRHRTPPCSHGGHPLIPAGRGRPADRRRRG